MINLRPLRDLIVAEPVAETNRVGLLFMPDNDLQALRTHFKMKVLAAGPDAKEYAPTGAEVHVSQSWGEEVLHEGKKVKIGRLRDINGVVL